MPNRNVRFNNLIDPDSGRQVAIDEIVTQEQLTTASSQQWLSNVNYGIGQEVVRNGLRYIARAASGPDNGGAVMPTNDAKIWHPVLPSAYSELDELSSWIKIAVVNGVQNLGGGGDFLSLEFIGWSDFGYITRFSADIMVIERNDDFSAIVSPKTLGSTNPTFYTKRVSANNFELWVKRNSAFPCPLTVIRKSRSRYTGTIAGILEKATTEPTGLTLVPYDTGYQFASIPLGMEVAFDTPPPTNDPRFRFVKLTADDAYNGSLLNNKVISGTAPNLVVKMTVNSALSPINGQQIEMLNTMGAIPTPGLTSGAIIQDAMRNLTGSLRSYYLAGNAQATGVLAHTVYGSTPAKGGVIGADPGANYTFDFDASRQVPTADRFQPFGVARVFYKRVY
jgi:hypothetical protein